MNLNGIMESNKKWHRREPCCVPFLDQIIFSESTVFVFVTQLYWQKRPGKADDIEESVARCSIFDIV